MKMLTSRMLLSGALACAACSASPEPDATDAELELGTTRQALKNTGGGLGATSCPGGGSPQCVTCVDAECVYACAGGVTCDTDSWPEPGGTASLCSAGSSCRTFAFGGGLSLASGGLSAQRAVSP